tara:strand:+ start:585 stop:965 length:381 start_codon:yes stop_codon:yes gene_type:complete
MKIRTLLSIIRLDPVDPSKMSLGFIEQGDKLESIMSTIKKNEGSALTALRLATDYIDVEVDWLDIQQVGFFDKEEEDTVILAYRVRLPSTVKMHKEPKWIELEELRHVYEKINQEELRIHLRSISV